MFDNSEFSEFDSRLWTGYPQQQKQQQQEQQHQQQQQQQQQHQQQSSASKICKRTISIILSQIGTFFIVLCYVALGGFVFEYLERGNEISSCAIKFAQFEIKLNEAVDTIYVVALTDNAEASKLAIRNRLNLFAMDAYKLNVDPQLNCSTLGNSEDNIPDWNFANAMYFCVTIITTIGYGHIAPATIWGKIVCMVYSILGIPIMLLFLTKIGEPTAVMFKSFYLNICCCKCFVKARIEELSTRVLQQQQQHQEVAKPSNRWTPAEEGELKQPPIKVSELMVVEEDEEDLDDTDEEVVTIPIIITILLLFLYIVIGAGVFKIWEDWSVVEGAYFSFITLSTIGFGDLVPGKDGPFNSTAVITELLIGAVYCIFGLTVLSMCINLIQDEISAKFHWIGLKLGLSKPINDDEDDDDDEEEEETTEDEDEAVVEEGEVDGKRFRHAVAYEA